jgi:hypothetical protein
VENSLYPLHFWGVTAVGAGQLGSARKLARRVGRSRIRNRISFNTFANPLSRPISVYRFPRRALTLCPQFCIGIQPGFRFPARSADALTATLYGHFTSAIYRNRPIECCPPDSLVRPWVRDLVTVVCQMPEDKATPQDYELLQAVVESFRVDF